MNDNYTISYQEGYIQERLHEHLEGAGIRLSKEEYKKAVDGVRYWLDTNMSAAIADSITSATDGRE